MKGWPEDIPFQSPTSLNNHNALLKLQNTLKDGSCHWFCMFPCQWEDYSTQLATHCKRGETIGKPHKKHSDAGVAHKGNRKENRHPKKCSRGSGASAQVLKSTEFVLSSDKDSTSEDKL